MLVELIKKNLEQVKLKTCLKDVFFQLIKCFFQVTLYYKFINNFYIHNSFKLKKLFHFKIFI